MNTELAEEVERAFLVADLSGYTALAEAHGNYSAAEIGTRYRQIIMGSVEGDVSLIDQIGDEALFAADDVSSIVRTAVTLHGRIEAEPLFPAVHMGINTGPAVFQNGRYFGTALNLAARIAAHAGGGQLLCTREVVNKADGLKRIQFKALGPVSFKNVLDPVEIFEIISSEGERTEKLIDPVCRMQVRPDTAVAKLPFGGKTYYFCSLECVESFMAHPERYAPS